MMNGSKTGTILFHMYAEIRSIMIFFIGNFFTVNLWISDKLIWIRSRWSNAFSNNNLYPLSPWWYKDLVISRRTTKYDPSLQNDSIHDPVGERIRCQIPLLIWVLRLTCSKYSRNFEHLRSCFLRRSCDLQTLKIKDDKLESRWLMTNDVEELIA